MTLFGIAFASSGILSQIFVGYDKELFELTKHAFRIYALSFLFNGFNIFASAFFTALNNGLVSAILSFLRMFLFQIVCVFALPAIFGIEGIWFSVSVAELLCLFVSITFIFKNKNLTFYCKVLTFYCFAKISFTISNSLSLVSITNSS